MIQVIRITNIICQFKIWPNSLKITTKEKLLNIKRNKENTSNTRKKKNVSCFFRICKLRFSSSFSFIFLVKNDCSCMLVSRIKMIEYIMWSMRQWRGEIYFDKTGDKDIKEDNFWWTIYSVEVLQIINCHEI